MLTQHILPPYSGQPADSAVILLHGLGDSGAGLIDLGEIWQQALPNTQFLAPDAPFACDMAPFGYQWFSLKNRDPATLLAEVQRAEPVLNDYIDTVLQTLALPANRLALVGFSQGTMLSLYVAPRRPLALAGIAAYSGAMIGAENLPAECLSKPPVLLVHGTADEIVPFSALAHAEQALLDAGLPVSKRVCQGLGHSIDNAGLREGLVFLRNVLI